MPPTFYHPPLCSAASSSPAPPDTSTLRSDTASGTMKNYQQLKCSRQAPTGTSPPPRIHAAATVLLLPTPEGVDSSHRTISGYYIGMVHRTVHRTVQLTTSGRSSDSTSDYIGPFIGQYIGQYIGEYIGLYRIVHRTISDRTSNYIGPYLNAYLGL
jgi:hypothetical protein